MTALWTVPAMAKAMGAERRGALPEGIGGLSIDTRTIAPGEAFFAIQGDARDGHDFVPAALASSSPKPPLTCRAHRACSASPSSLPSKRSFRSRG